MPARENIKTRRAQGVRWVRDWEHGRQYVDHRDGIAWFDAPIPPEDHECAPQTRGLVEVGTLPIMGIMRCACGAVNLYDNQGWQEKCTRRR